MASGRDPEEATSDQEHQAFVLGGAIAPDGSETEVHDDQHDVGEGDDEVKDW